MKTVLNSTVLNTCLNSSVPGEESAELKTFSTVTNIEKKGFSVASVCEVRKKYVFHTVKNETSDVILANVV